MKLLQRQFEQDLRNFSQITQALHFCKFYFANIYDVCQYNLQNCIALRSCCAYQTSRELFRLVSLGDCKADAHGVTNISRNAFIF